MQERYYNLIHVVKQEDPHAIIRKVNRMLREGNKDGRI